MNFLDSSSYFLLNFSNFQNLFKFLRSEIYYTCFNVEVSNNSDWGLKNVSIKIRFRMRARTIIKCTTSQQATYPQKTSWFIEPWSLVWWWLWNFSVLQVKFNWILHLNEPPKRIFWHLIRPFDWTLSKIGYFQFSMSILEAKKIQSFWKWLSYLNVYLGDQFFS